MTHTPRLSNAHHLRNHALMLPHLMARMMTMTLIMATYALLVSPTYSHFPFISTPNLYEYPITPIAQLYVSAPSHLSRLPFSHSLPLIQRPFPNDGYIFQTTWFEQT